MSSTQNRKSKFRSTSKWKKFRSKLKSERKVDYVTQKKLLKGWNCHHLDMRDENYQDLSDETKYVCVNKQTHEVIHTIFRYYQSDPTYLDRLKEILDKMVEINQ